jgi:hypothetical protein
MYTNPRIKGIAESYIQRANKVSNPSLNQSVEELSGEPSDRTAYDFAGTEQELATNNK